MFQTFIGVTAIAAMLSLINKKVLRLPDTIGVMILAIVISLLLAVFSYFDEASFSLICNTVQGLDFRSFLFDFLLGFLLFAGAIHVNIKELTEESRSVFLYATLGVLVSTFVVGTFFYFAAGLFGLSISYLYCLVFGALISPTDPIAVLALLQKAGTSKSTEIKIVGESLFNDGVGIVIFLTLLSLASMVDAEVDVAHIAEEFGQEVGGGLFLGFVLGYLGNRLLQSLREEPIVAVHISVAIVMGGYSLASLLQFSGALAMVVAGLVIGQGLHSASMGEAEKNYITLFWKVIDEILNSILFVLIGIEIISLRFEMSYLLLGILAIFIVLLARYLSLVVANFFLSQKHRANANELGILTWAGLRGGISIGLVLTLPESEIRDLLLFTTYTVVAFSIIVQGLSIEKLVKWINN